MGVISRPASDIWHASQDEPARAALPCHVRIPGRCYGLSYSLRLPMSPAATCKEGLADQGPQDMRLDRLHEPGEASIQLDLACSPVRHRQI